MAATFKPSESIADDISHHFDGGQQMLVPVGDPSGSRARKLLDGTSSHQKRDRSQNWDHVEKCVLVQLVQKRLEYIDNKASDLATIRRRSQAWQDIYEEFSRRVGGVPRDLQRIREQWRRMKNWARQEMNDFHETGGYSKRGGSDGGSAGQNRRKPNELARYITQMKSGLQEDTRLGYLSTSDRFEMNATQSIQGSATDLRESPDCSVVPVAVVEAVIGTVKEEEVELIEATSSSAVVDEVGALFAGDQLVAQKPICTSLLPVQQQVQLSAQRQVPSLPSWTKEFPEIIGRHEAGPDPNVASPPRQPDGCDAEQIIEEDDGEDYLDDSYLDDDDDMGSLNEDWGAVDPPRTENNYGPISRNTALSVKFEKQRLLFVRQEFKRRMQMMEAQHASKMQLLSIRRDTAMLQKRQLALQFKQYRQPVSSSNNLQGRRQRNVYR